MFNLRTVSKVAGCVMWLGLMSGVDAAVIPLVEQLPIEIGNPATGGIGIFSAKSDDPLEPRAKAWENFTLPRAAAISSLNWLGSFNNIFNPNADLRGTMTFQIEVFGNLESGSPDLDELLYSTTLDAGLAGIDNGENVSKQIVPDATSRGGGIVVAYAAVLPTFELEAGDYWLSIVAEQTLPSPHPDDEPDNLNAHLDPIWAWVRSSGGDNRMYQFDAREDAAEPGLLLTTGTCASQDCDVSFTLLGTPPSTGVFGDFNGSGEIDPEDIDLLSWAIRRESSDLGFDLNTDGLVDLADHNTWVSDAAGTLVGDTDLNQEVSFADFLPLSAFFGQIGGWAKGDFDGDNQIQFSDFLLLAENFGRTAGGAVAANVPEPSFSRVNLLVTFLLSVIFTRNLGSGKKVS